MQKRVVAIGEILWDMLPSGRKPGGSSMNVALNLHKQGVDCAFVSAIGRDAAGRELCDFLAAQNFSAAFIQQNALPTSTVDVTLDASGQATYTIAEPVAWDAIDASPALLQMAREADAFVYCSLTCRSSQTRSTVLQLLEYASFRVFDINLRPPHFSPETLAALLHAADLLKINEEEIVYLQQTFDLQPGDESRLLKQISQKFDIPVICLTLGGAGARVWSGDMLYAHPGYQVAVADTVGAGDAFLATFVASYLQGYPLETTLDRACKVGAFVASQPGANPEYGPTVFN
ncbi:carbohydrate kinase [Pedobacter yulinensis]|uniref:Carbohydrate kinase n=1 Tax=Pedobacter yulinensis TaxID=2126353 RepID=A0A2T3HNR0_9SPHI|nr:carbohydrate kinase [Pedobacter yulinensis]PST84084.1 carbohydrate kinase [Pedobacter yulinensis]